MDNLFKRLRRSLSIGRHDQAGRQSTSTVRVAESICESLPDYSAALQGGPPRYSLSDSEDDDSHTKLDKEKKWSRHQPLTLDTPRIAATRAQDQAIVDRYFNEHTFPCSGSKRSIALRLKEIAQDSESYISLRPIDDNLFDLLGSFEGPPETPYAGGIFFIRMVIPQDFPFSPPRCRFLTKVYHPNIDHKGEFCVEILQRHWNPKFARLDKLLMALQGLLAHPDLEDPLVHEIALVYRENRAGFEQTARRYTTTYATGELPPLDDESLPSPRPLSMPSVDDLSPEIQTLQMIMKHLETVSQLRPPDAWSYRYAPAFEYLGVAAQTLQRQIQDNLIIHASDTVRISQMGGRQACDRLQAGLEILIQAFEPGETSTIKFNSPIEDLELFMIMLEVMEPSAVRLAVLHAVAQLDDISKFSSTYLALINGGNPLEEPEDRWLRLVSRDVDKLQLRHDHRHLAAVELMEKYAGVFQSILLSPVCGRWLLTLKLSVNKRIFQHQTYCFVASHVALGKPRRNWQMGHLKHMIIDLDYAIEYIGGRCSVGYEKQAVEDLFPNK